MVWDKRGLSVRPSFKMAATPICRCRVLYLGSAVPHASKDGLQGIQGPLRELYPEGGARGARGIDSWLSVWSNGLLLENVDEHRQEVTRFFPISSLHYCAAVRHVLVPERGNSVGAKPVTAVVNGAQPRFLPLDSPFAAAPSAMHPPLFAAILRRTTGIKVLECHVFICKREAAANALVRCCFHAYADSSYAKHIDGGGGGGENGAPESIYGTLRGENWRRASTTSLSNGHHHNGIIDFDSNDGEVDDASVYNGDENHKVWAGRDDDDKDNGNGIYGYGGSGDGATLRSRGRNSRPRQVTEPVPPPPPPPPPTTTPTKAEKERNKERNKIRGEMYPVRHGRPRSAMSLGMQMHPPMHPPMHPSLPPHPGVMMTLPPPGRMFVPMAPLGRRVPPGPPNPRFLFAPPPPPPPPPPQFVATLGRRRIAAEEPVYMPSARPLSPVASYQPGHFPHDAYLLQHYATATLDGRGKKKKKKGKKNGVPVPVPIPVLIPPPAPSQLNGAAVTAVTAATSATASPDNHHDSSGENSPSGTGIYRKKGHLNERAFSYSIRQEHRSRSHGSLVSLKFSAPPNAAAGSTGPATDHKKEREIVHMMRGLDLMGDDLERSEVPPAVLNAAKQSNSRTLR